MKWRETVDCGCKINLRLKVTAKRADGLHELSSCFLYLPFPGDLLTVEDSDSGLALECPGFPELANEKNLVWRAAELFAAESKITPAWKIVLEKIVPMAAGLGGGSADAGALLALLNDRYRTVSSERLEKLAFSLGADVPFFIKRTSAWVTGAGECFEYFEKMPYVPEVLIINPAFPVSAKWAYVNMPKTLIGPDDPQEKADFLAGKCDWQRFCLNDLAPAVMKKFPLLGILERKLRDCGALAVQMSGSGPSLFALYEPGKAAAAGEKMRCDFAGLNGLRIFAGGKEF